MNKNEARKYGLSARSRLTKEERKQASACIMQQVKERIAGYHHIGCFISMKDEVNTHVLFEMEDVHVYAPRVTNKTLTFHEVHDFSKLKRSAFGVLEPDESNPADLSQIEVMIVPLSAFDEKLHRTGYGKGYYDSVLRDSMLKIGIAYSVQQTDCFETDPWDVDLDEIITENGINLPK